MAPDRIRFEDEEVQEETEGSGREVELRCRKCRYVRPSCSMPAWQLSPSSMLVRFSYRQGIRGENSACINKRANDMDA